MPERRRQEVLNVELAALLRKHGVAAEAELIVRARGGRGVRMPDVLVTFRGLRIGIEAEVGDTPDASRKALSSAVKRVEDGLTQLGVAVVYPKSLRRHPRRLEKSQVRFAVVSEYGQTAYIEGSIDALAQAIRQAYDTLIREDAVASAADLLDEAISDLTDELLLKPGVLRRLASELAMPVTGCDGDADEELVEEQLEAVSNVSGLVLANALMFNEVLSAYDERVRPIESLAEGGGIVHAAAEHWELIVREIDYYPIFHIAQRLLSNLSSDNSVSKAVSHLAHSARRIVENRAALRHDLMGRIYHRLLAQAKYRGTYFTRIPAATLLLGLVLSDDKWQLDWADYGALREFRVADLSCGTGTLLMASADAMLNNHVRARAAKAGRVDLHALHRSIVEHVLYGYDVELSALHLTG
ncbi:MAG: hypothetical protein JXA57_05105, partial [Armatimonadetes bacterium]|nr:hypothetical protein [Armatimonadota bacterium]